MRLGLQVSYFSWSDAPDSMGPTFGRIARNAEAAGLASLWAQRRSMAWRTSKGTRGSRRAPRPLHGVGLVRSR